MYRDYRVVAFTPAGRKRQMSVLVDNLSRFTDIIDEYQVWMNTDPEQKEDTEWLRSLPTKYDWVKLVELPKKFKRLSPKQMNTGLFYMDNTIEEDTIYIRFDDDIIYVDDDFFVNMLDFRIDNPEYFLVMANIWNNAIISWVHQQLGNIPSDEYEVEEPYCMDPVGWRSGPFAEMIHELLLDKIDARETSDLFFDRADLKNAARFSISCFCFFGKDFKEFGGRIGQPEKKWDVAYDEEIWLAEIYTTEKDKVNTICGSALVSHYSFFAQRPYLDKKDILKRYKTWAKQELLNEYYTYLDEANEKEKGKSSSRKAEKGEWETVDIPPTDYISPIIEAMRARKLGYRTRKTKGQVEILKGDKVIGKIGGKNVRGRIIDQKLVHLYRKHG